MKLIALLTMMQLTATGAALAGNELGNGGDGFAQEFVTLGRAVAQEVSNSGHPAIADPKALRKAVEETKVVTVENLQLEGNPVDAINYPSSKRIELSRSRWKDYSAEQKRALVLHEYLGIARIDDHQYQLSGNYSVAESEDEEGPRNRFLVGIGSGRQSFYGNLGRLYGNTGPTLNVRFGYLLHPYLVVGASMEKSAADTTTAEAGETELQLTKISAAAHLHFLRNAQWAGSRGIDPYLVASAGEVFRTQIFQSMNRVEKDNALSVEGGAGASLEVIPHRAAIWLEARLGQVYFKDRFEQTYLPVSGLPDTTGPMLTGSLGFQYFF